MLPSQRNLRNKTNGLVRLNVNSLLQHQKRLARGRSTVAAQVQPKVMLVWQPKMMPKRSRLEVVTLDIAIVQNAPNAECRGIVLENQNET